MTLLDIDSIDTAYGESQVLFEVSLQVEENESIGLIGRNGAGKTTTFRSVMGLTPPERGEIRYRGENIVGLAPHEIAKNGIGYVPEHRGVLPDITVQENLELAQTDSSQMSIQDVYELFPQLEERRNSPNDVLSGGEQQMLAIARVLLRDVDVLLLDEPTEGLAPLIVEDIEEIIQTIRQEDFTLMIAEQNIDFIFNTCDRCYIIEKGQIVAEKSVEELKEQPEVINRHLAVG